MNKSNKLIKLMCMLLAFTMLFALVGCDDSTSGGLTDKTKAKIALLVNGNLGDKSFFDSANDGLNMIKKAYPDTTVKAIEMGTDRTKYKGYVDDACEGYDVIIMGTWEMYNHMSYACTKYPDKKFFLFDYAGDFSNDKGKDNLYSMEFKQNQAAFLGGVLSAGIALDSTLPLSKGSKKVGFVGGADSPIIKDFLVGFIEGVHYADPNFDNKKPANHPDNSGKVTVNSTFISTFVDPTRAKESANILYNTCDIVFAAASQAGLGALDAAVESNKYYLACDSDQIRLFEDNPTKQKNIAGSVLKKVDVAIFRAFKNFVDGNLAWGTNERLGFEEDCIGFAGYNADIPQALRQKVADAEALLKNGTIKVTTAIGSTADGTIVDGIIDAAK